MTETLDVVSESGAVEVAADESSVDKTDEKKIYFIHPLFSGNYSYLVKLLYQISMWLHQT